MRLLPLGLTKTILKQLLQRDSGLFDEHTRNSV